MLANSNLVEIINPRHHLGSICKVKNTYRIPTYCLVCEKLPSQNGIIYIALGYWKTKCTTYYLNEKEITNFYNYQNHSKEIVYPNKKL